MNYYFNIHPVQLLSYFDERVRKWCEQCKRFNQNSSCPPLIESIDYYKNLIKNYDRGTLIVKKFIIEDIASWKELGKESSEELRYALLYLKNVLKVKNTLQFGAGSCKYCDSCIYPCRFPDKRLISLEGIGINVVKLVSDISFQYIKIKFPVEKYRYFYRIGLLLWRQDEKI